MRAICYVCGVAYGYTSAVTGTMPPSTAGTTTAITRGR